MKRYSKGLNIAVSHKNLSLWPLSFWSTAYYHIEFQKGDKVSVVGVQGGSWKICLLSLEHTKTSKVSVCLCDLLPLQMNVVESNTLYNLKSYYTCSPQNLTVAVLSVCIKFQGLSLKTSVSSMSDLAGCTPVSNLELVYGCIVTRTARGKQGDASQYTAALLRCASQYIRILIQDWRQECSLPSLTSTRLMSCLPSLTSTRLMSAAVVSNNAGDQETLISSVSMLR